MWWNLLFHCLLYDSASLEDDQQTILAESLNCIQNMACNIFIIYFSKEKRSRSCVIPFQSKYFYDLLPETRPEAVFLQLKHLISKEMEHTETNTPYLSAVPVLYQVLRQKVKVFMVSANKQDLKGKLFQPIQLFVLLFSPIQTPPKSPQMIT